jgi:type IV secretory pathway component VirB8
MKPKKEHAPSDVALGARDRRRLFVLIVVLIAVAVAVAIVIVVITLEPDRRHIDLLGTGRYFVSINAN